MNTPLENPFKIFLFKIVSVTKEIAALILNFLDNFKISFELKSETF